MTRGSLVVGLVFALLVLGPSREGAPQSALTPGDNLFAKRKSQDFQLYATVMFVRRFLLGEDVSPGGR